MKRLPSKLQNQTVSKFVTLPGELQCKDGCGATGPQPRNSQILLLILRQSAFPNYQETCFYAVADSWTGGGGVGWGEGLRASHCIFNIAFNFTTSFQSSIDKSSCILII